MTVVLSFFDTLLHLKLHIPRCSFADASYLPGAGFNAYIWCGETVY